MEKNREFYEKSEIINTNKKVHTDCNSYTLLNVGPDTANYLGIDIPTGQQYIMRGHPGEHCTTSETIKFLTSAAPQVILIRYLYRKN